jgi:hypothetical protein
MLYASIQALHDVCCRCASLSEELSATRELWDNAAVPNGRPLIVFNGELDRLRGGYYPAWGFPELAKLTKEWLPQVECAYFIHNFKGSRPGGFS